jgi:hypothetical protein
MTLALVISLASDRRSGRVLDGTLVPADQAVKKVKQLITDGRAPDPRFPIVAAISAGNILREHRFNPTQAEFDASEETTQVPDADALNAALAANAALEEQVKALTAKLEAAKADKKPTKKPTKKQLQTAAVEARAAADAAKEDALKAKQASEAAPNDEALAEAAQAAEKAALEADAKAAEAEAAAK